MRLRHFMGNGGSESAAEPPEANGRFATVSQLCQVTTSLATVTIRLDETTVFSLILILA
jgi:hypothetical protein